MLDFCDRPGNGSKKTIRWDTLFFVRAAWASGMNGGMAVRVEGAEMEGFDPLFLTTTSHLAWGDLEKMSARMAQQSLRAKATFTLRIINQSAAVEWEGSADAEREQKKEAVVRKSSSKAQIHRSKPSKYSLHQIYIYI